VLRPLLRRLSAARNHRSKSNPAISNIPLPRRRPPRETIEAKAIPKSQNPAISNISPWLLLTNNAQLCEHPKTAIEIMRGTCKLPFENILSTQLN